MEQILWKSKARVGGVVLATVGLLLITFAAVSPNASAAPNPSFQGVCVGNLSSGTCTLDEPEGNDPSTQGTVTYDRGPTTMTFVIAADDPISEVQICMASDAPFAQGANVCAGIHGHHVAYTNTGDVYVVDLLNEGFANADPLYWTLHVVAGGRTLQVIATTDPGLPPTTTTVPPTTTTTVPETTTTVPPTTTTVPPTTTTVPPTTTTVPPTTTTVPPTTTTVPPTTTTVPPTTTTVPPTTTTVPEETTTTIPETTTTVPVVTTTTIPDTTTTTVADTTTTTLAVTTTTAPAEVTTSSTLPTAVLGANLARTGGFHQLALVGGVALLLLGAVLVLLERKVGLGGAIG